eukprot:g987.t1
MSSSDSESEEVYDLSNSDVVTKYKAAAEICNNAITEITKAIQPEARIVDLISKGNQFVEERISRIFKGKNIEKGIAFPVCISLNNVVGNYCPLESDLVLKEGDLVKIDLGVHIDGFIAIQAGTLQVQNPTVPVPIKDRVGDLIQATRTAYQVALRLIRPGKRISGVSPVLTRVAELFGCQLVEGVMTHQLKRFVIDGNKCVLNKTSPEHRVDDDEFEENEVYAVDIVMSTGDGKTRMLDEKETMIYKRALDREYNLRLKAARFVFTEINRRFPTMPFTIGALTDQKQVRLGLVECMNHGLLQPYPVMHEKPGEFVAQVKGTVLLMPSGSDIITQFPNQDVECSIKIEDSEILALLEEEIEKKKKTKKKKTDSNKPPNF